MSMSWEGRPAFVSRCAMGEHGGWGIARKSIIAILGSADLRSYRRQCALLAG